MTSIANPTQSACCLLLLLWVVGCSDGFSHAGAGYAGKAGAAGTSGSAGTTSTTVTQAGTAAGGSTSSATSSATCGVTCTDDKPICDTTTGECVACTSDAHCGAATPVCDTATHTCKGCTGDSYCANPTPACDTANQSCVTCMSDAHCSGSTPACNVSSVSSTSNVCVECTKRDHCTDTPSTPVCKTEATKCVECLANTDCANRSTLQGTSGAAGTAGASGRSGGAAGSGVAGTIATAGAPNAPTSTPKPVCDTVANACVGCLASTDCAGTPSTPVCDTESKTCVACLSNAHCNHPNASRCDVNPSSPTANTCLPCAASTDCIHVDGKHLCLSDTARPNRCVACTVADESACNGNSCNPKTNECTTTPRNSIGLCGACTADSECATGTGITVSRCIPMTFGPSATPHGSYCLESISSGCDQPYGSTSAMKITAISVSSAPGTDYCGINQEFVTCEAILDMQDASNTVRCVNAATNQPDDTLCGCPRDPDGKCIKAGQGGLCRDINGASRCTTQCGGGSECRMNYTCLFLDAPSYCG